ncbi:sulfatase [Aestuariibaculum marinum]|uniref:Sulfatase n=1 Tax=Aestuariibaculum marinum TaxID=2683592 RepID=A0A8J6PW41_9FLAO|nr:sulfatase [Aestuariibaculum marinum]MBD0825184.1 sulfatase [Aestuariibaculum marinum]
MRKILNNYNKRQKGIVFTLLLMFGSSLYAQKKYNVLFIAIDDLNDYVSLLEDYPGLKTPNLDKFSKESITFSKAYTAAPACNPSRSAVLTGLSPVVTGIYDNSDNFQNSEEAMAATLIPEHFKNNGYITMWSGKLFHSRPNRERIQKMWDDMDGHDGGYGPMPKQPNVINKIKSPRMFDYESWNGPDSDFSDVKNTDLTIQRLQDEYEAPFFMTLGLYRPHNPWTAPKRFFDMYPLEDLKMPTVLENDLDDVPPVGKAWAENPVKLDDLKSIKQWKPIVRSYLASISFMDYNLGRVLEALENSKYKDNTIVVLWADHGFHMGEKKHFAKFALWEKTTHTLFMVKIPDGPKGEKRDQPVNLLDIYPTLIDYCNLPKVDQDLNGVSLRHIIEDRQYKRKTPSITYYQKASIGVRTDNWRYIRYFDGSEELYNHKKDPNEWHNLANKSRFKDVIRDFQKWLPNNIKTAVGPGKN